MCSFVLTLSILTQLLVLWNLSNNCELQTDIFALQNSGKKKEKKNTCHPKATSIHSLNTYLNHIKTHIDNVSEGSAVIPCAWVTLEGIGEVTTIKVVVAKVIMTSPNGFLDTINLCGWERESERGEVILVLCQVLCKLVFNEGKRKKGEKIHLAMIPWYFQLLRKKKDKFIYSEPVPIKLPWNLKRYIEILGDLYKKASLL